MTDQQKKKKKIKFPWGIIIWFLCCMVVGVVLGILMAENDVKFDAKPLDILFILLAFVAAFYLHVIFHEGGHWLAGRMTGYTFVSYRIGSFMWEKQKDNKIRFCRFSLAGTGGQCLMAPPEYNEGNYPYLLYNLGGGLMNFVLAGIAGLMLMLPLSRYMNMFLWVVIFVGVLTGFINLIPLKKLNNDGSNIIEISKSPAARKAFWLQMRINQEIAKGVRPKDMPDEWFERQTENRKNVMVTAIDVMAASRLMDDMQLDAAEKAMQELMEESCLATVYKGLLTFELSSLEMLKGEEGPYTEKTEEKTQQQFLKTMKTFPSILRWQYIKAKLRDRDEQAAQKAKAAFEKMEKHYPHPCELISEKQMMQLADEKANLIPLDA